jgi:hypothetical protein
MEGRKNLGMSSTLTELNCLLNLEYNHFLYRNLFSHCYRDFSIREVNFDICIET